MFIKLRQVYATHTGGSGKASRTSSEKKSGARSPKAVGSTGKSSPKSVGSTKTKSARSTGANKPKSPRAIFQSKGRVK